MYGTSWETTKTVRFVYCPACGGRRTQKLVWDGLDNDNGTALMPHEWYRYEIEGQHELRVDERYGIDGARLSTADTWRTLRYTVHGPGQISHQVKEVRFAYQGDTNTVDSETVFYYHFDRLGNVLALSDAEGQALAGQDFVMDAFGVDQADWTQDTYTTRRITGKEYDKDIGLYFFEARWYDPEVGRFVSRDPVGTPLFRSLYAFCDNAPTIFVDPTGETETREECLEKAYAKRDDCVQRWIVGCHTAFWACLPFLPANICFKTWVACQIGGLGKCAIFYAKDVVKCKNKPTGCEEEDPEDTDNPT